MFWSRMGRALLATVALAAIVAGAGGGRAATLALSRAVATTGDSVVALNDDARLPTIPADLHDQLLK
jgi:hypothetical protein